jgi:ADP-L-glycero-D-manno-heptose 6-epimerase
MIVVTGGAGFIGSAFVHRLNREGVSDVLIVDRLGQGGKWRNLVNLSYRDYLHKDVFLPELEKGRLQRPEAIVHLGACTSTAETDADYLLENNYRYSARLARYALREGVRFVYASSAATYGDGRNGFDDDPDRLGRLKPLNPYAYSKHLFDCWLRRQGLLDRVAGLKFFNVYGPNEDHKGDMRSMVRKAWEQIRESGRVQLFRSHREGYEHGGQRRDFVYVRDCAQLLLWFLRRPEVCGLYNAGTGEARTWNDLAGAVFRALGQPERIDFVDMPVHLRDTYQYYTRAETARLRALGAPVPNTSLEEGVREYVAMLESGDPYLGGER